MTDDSTSQEVRRVVELARDACCRPAMFCGVPEPTFDCLWSFIEGLEFSVLPGAFLTVFEVWLQEFCNAPDGTRPYSYFRLKFEDDRKACAELERLLGECFGSDTDPRPPGSSQF